MQTIGILSGDIVGSRAIDDKQALRDALDLTLARVRESFGGVGMRYRGDAFQIAIPDGADVMRAAVLIRASLLEHSPSRRQPWDARVSASLGGSEMPTEGNFTDADGPAFVRSGQGLDDLSRNDQRLGLFLSQEQREIDLLIRFVDDIVGQWSHNAAEVVRLSLTTSLTQSELAIRLERSQPTINRRLTAARWSLVKDFLTFMRQRLESLA
ncbi:hypothetical protein [Salinicola aestuarinus]|uniref:hypothetical protein n=1 Tax=Salinicola aestuarinus TaxID=1949082 RepID=UPI000DA2645C|nr:hypothetical protein [Salinicola aestuarinus]